MAQGFLFLGCVKAQVHTHLKHPQSCTMAETTAIVPFAGDGQDDGELSCSGSDVEWDWRNCLPDGNGGDQLQYVQALQLLGIDMAKAVPPKHHRLAITPLNQPPEMDLFVGVFSKSTTKERLLNLSCNY